MSITRRLVLAALVMSAALARAETRAPALPFIENDFDKAMSEAAASAKPIFVEVWAPW